MSTAAKTIWMLIVLLLAVVGCGEGRDPHGRLALTGTVMFKGEPVDGGSIRFQALEDNGLSAGALIKDGTYQIPREQGLPPGVYKVVISALEPTPIPTGAPGENPAPPAKERIPAKYNVESKEKIEIKADQNPKFDFTIE